MRFTDRVSGKSSSSLAGPLVLGQWLVEAGDAEVVRQNGQTLRSGDAVVPAQSGHWACEGRDNAQCGGHFFGQAAPGNQDYLALEQLGQGLDRLIEADGGWSQWSDVSPLAPGLDDSVDLHPFEKVIERDLEYLARVCHHPRTHIRVEDERVLTSRARRISSRASEWLASHTQDWEQRKLSGVHPRQILANVREEQWELYENRLAARLVDGLAAWLRQRIVEVSRILEQIFCKLEGVGDSSRHNRFLLRRLCSLLGEAWENSEAKAKAELTLKILRSLQHRVLRLMDSPLYRHIPRQASVPAIPTPTNLLVNDDNYRGVARLFGEWSKVACRQTSEADHYARMQGLHRSFIQWCALLVIRACDQVGVKPVGESGVKVPIAPGGKLALGTGVEFDWSSKGILSISIAGSDVVRFVPICHNLEGAQSADEAFRRIAPLASATGTCSCWTVFLHRAQTGESVYPFLAGVGTPPEPSVRGPIDFVRVSPFDIASVERVARIIRWAVLVPRMLEYPPKVHLAGEFCDKVSGPAWKRTGEAECLLLRPLNGKDPLLPELRKSVEEADGQLKALNEERESAAAEQRQHRGDRRALGELNARKTQLNGAIDEARRRLESCRKARDSVEAANRTLALLAMCPCCGKPADVEPREANCFKATCFEEGCGAIWELRKTERTAERTPCLLRDGLEEFAVDSELQAHRIDDILGCDVLAVPVRADDLSVQFLPPRKTRFAPDVEKWLSRS